MRYACPNCGSADLVKFSVLHAAGTGTAHYGGTSVMAGSGGGVGIGVHGGTSHLSTELAAACAPPKRPEDVGDGCGCAGGIALLACIVLFGILDTVCKHTKLSVEAAPEWAQDVIFGGVVVLGLWIAFLCWCRMAERLQRERDQCRAAWDQWLRTWRCMRCGQAWIFDE